MRKLAHPSMPLTLSDVYRIAAETLLDPRTISKAYAGAPVTLGARANIRRAAEKLGLPMPPEASPRSIPGRG